MTEAWCKQALAGVSRGEPVLLCGESSVKSDERNEESLSIDLRGVDGSTEPCLRGNLRSDVETGSNTNMAGAVSQNPSGRGEVGTDVFWKSRSAYR